MAYQVLRSAGLSSVSALVLSGVLPAVAVLGGLVRHRHLDAVGLLVLAGIAVGTVPGLLTGNRPAGADRGFGAHGDIRALPDPAAVTPAADLPVRCGVHGSEHPAGRDFGSLWQYPGFRHAFWLFTVVWGVTYLAEAVARIAIVETTSTGTALAVSKVMPYAVGGLLALWMVIYGRHTRRQGERLAAPDRRCRPDRRRPDHRPPSPPPPDHRRLRQARLRRCPAGAASAISTRSPAATTGPRQGRG